MDWPDLERSCGSSIVTWRDGEEPPEMALVGEARLLGGLRNLGPLGQEHLDLSLEG